EVVERLGTRRGVLLGSVSLAGPRAGAQFLIGRDRHLAALRDAYHASTRGSAVTVCVEGSSGIGKTELVKRFLAELAGDEWEPLILSSRCYQQESVPYKAVDGIIDSLARHLMRLSAVEAARPLPPRARNMSALARVFPALKDVDPLRSPRSDIPAAI